MTLVRISYMIEYIYGCCVCMAQEIGLLLARGCFIVQFVWL